MKILLCGFDDLLHGAAKLGVPRISLAHLPFTEDDIQRADIVGVMGSNRALILKDRTGAFGIGGAGVTHAAELLDILQSEASK